MYQDIVYRLTKADIADRARALDGYAEVQEAKDKALAILSSSGIALASALLTTDLFRTASVAVKIVMLLAMGCFATVILKLLFSYSLSITAHEVYIEEIDKGNKCAGRENFYARKVILCDKIMLISFIAGVLVYAVDLCFLVFR